jgi:glutamate---cysteine ligase / carboxylate-amine ligase
MEHLNFTPSSSLTLGAELELQLLDPETLDLKPSSPAIVGEVGEDFPKIKPELFQSMIEINTGICRDAHAVGTDLAGTLDLLERLGRRHEVLFASAGTHPFARWDERILYPAERYVMLLDRNQWIARRLTIYALHLHLGMPSGEHAIAMQNALLHHLPVFLALSASSPFWQGHDTGLASSRITAFEAIPTGGHPCIVQSWAEFSNLTASLHRAGAISSLKDLWWDIRPNLGFGTLEIRVCDAPPTLAELVALVAFMHATAAAIDVRLRAGEAIPPPTDWMVRENKWRASRHGVSADLIIAPDGSSRSLEDEVERLFSCAAEQCLTFGYERQFDLLREILQKGPSYARQRALFSGAGSAQAVARGLVAELARGHPEWTTRG